METNANPVIGMRENLKKSQKIEVDIVDVVLLNTKFPYL